MPEGLLGTERVGAEVMLNRLQRRMAEGRAHWGEVERVCNRAFAIVATGSSGHSEGNLHDRKIFHATEFVPIMDSTSIKLRERRPRDGSYFSSDKVVELMVREGEGHGETIATFSRHGEITVQFLDRVEEQDLYCLEAILDAVEVSPDK